MSAAFVAEGAAAPNVRIIERDRVSRGVEERTGVAPHKYTTLPEGSVQPVP